VCFSRCVFLQVCVSLWVRCIGVEGAAVQHEEGEVQHEEGEVQPSVKAGHKQMTEVYTKPGVCDRLCS
jgi:hypothetical protein